MKLIPLDAVLAEFNRLIAELVEKGEDTMFEQGRISAFEDAKLFLDTLEVKEVDLDKETTHYLLYEHRSSLNEIMHKADLKSEMQYHKDIENAFKAGFGLGIAVSNKAQK